MLRGRRRRAGLTCLGNPDGAPPLLVQGLTPRGVLEGQIAGSALRPGWLAATRRRAGALPLTTQGQGRVRGVDEVAVGHRWPWRPPAGVWLAPVLGAAGGRALGVQARPRPHHPRRDRRPPTPRRGGRAARTGGPRPRPRPPTDTSRPRGGGEVLPGRRPRPGGLVHVLSAQAGGLRQRGIVGVPSRGRTAAAADDAPIPMTIPAWERHT